MWLRYQDHHFRVGGTKAGPSIMALADFAAYAALMGTVEPVQIVVMSGLSINFLRRPVASYKVSEARIVKTTKRLAFDEVDLFTAGEVVPIIHVASTYVILNSVTVS
jgi:acyl-coenzyme A thioesterase PaaI-like protein